MAQNLNTVSIIGNLVRDSELKQAGSTSVLNFTLAVNESMKKGDNYEDYANFIDVTLFGKRAESLSQYLKKGQKVAVNGHLHQDRWQDKEGKTQSRIGVRADVVELIGGRPNNSGNSGNVTPENYPENIPF